MNPARHAQVKRLFFAACELGPEAAAAFLEQACGEDRELLKEVESLLAHHTASTLLPPVDGQAETTPLVPGQMTDPDAVAVSEEQRIPVGEVVAGRYRVLGLLGRGGVGEVYRAHDLRLGQDVALKFLRADRLSRPTRWADFAAEVRLARRVSHPNVNRVHDLGEWNGERFISMELVEGEDLGSLLRREGPMTADAAIDYTESGNLHTDLNRLTDVSDGFFDRVHSLREVAHADMVSLWVASTTAKTGNSPRVWKRLVAGSKSQ